MRQLRRGRSKKVRIGKVTEPILQRSVLRPLSGLLPERTTESGRIYVSVYPIAYPVREGVRYAIAGACNDLAAAGAVPAGITLEVFLPKNVPEQRLKQMMGVAAQVAEVPVLGGHTEVCAGIRDPLVSVQAIGYIDRNDFRQVDAGDVILLAGQIGISGTQMLLEEKKDELREAFPAHFLQNTEKKLRGREKISHFAQLARRNGAVRMQDLSGGGILSCLWEFFGGKWQSGGASGMHSGKVPCGMEIDFRKIPILQETIEICEWLQVNPYYLHSQGGLLIAVPREQVEQFTQAFICEGFPLTELGACTAGRAGILRNGEEVRYLDKPQPDEILRILADPDESGEPDESDESDKSGGMQAGKQR